jgi:hypothetical protein
MLERIRDLLGAALLKDPAFEVHRIAVVGHVLRPFLF